MFILLYIWKTYILSNVLTGCRFVEIYISGYQLINIYIMHLGDDFI